MFRVTAKTKAQWRSLRGVPAHRIAELWGVHRDTVYFHLNDYLAAKRRKQWCGYKRQHGASKPSLPHPAL